MIHTADDRQLGRTNTFNDLLSPDEDNKSKRPQRIHPLLKDRNKWTVTPSPPTLVYWECFTSKENNQINKASSSSIWEVQIHQTSFQFASHPDCVKINGLFTEKRVSRKWAKRSKNGSDQIRHICYSLAPPIGCKENLPQHLTEMYHPHFETLY